MSAAWIVGAAIVVGVFALLQERSSGAARRRGLRAMAIVLALACLVLLAVRPAWWPALRFDEAVLVTPGATGEELAAATAASGGPGFVLTARSDPAGFRRPPLEIPDAGYLRRHFPGLKRLRVVGDGLDPWDWNRVEAEVLPAAGQAAVPGVLRVRWPREVVLGSRWVVRGVARGDNAGQSLVLVGPGGDEGRVALRDDRESVFELSATPRDRGRLLYRLELRSDPSPDSGDDSAGDPVAERDKVRLVGELDVAVQEPPPLKALWIEASPHFETGHFKRWFAGRGDALVIRSAISRGRTRTEIHNHPEIRAGRLTATLLGGFDVAIVDGRSLRALSSSEAETLRAAVREGLGLLIRSDGAVPSRTEGGPLTRWPVRALEDLERLEVHPRWPGADEIAELTVEPREIVATAGLDPLVADRAGGWLAAARVDGRGTVALTLVEDSYRWILRGNAEDHARYWSHLLERIARPSADERWIVPPGPLRLHDPIELALRSNAAEPRCTVTDPRGESIELPLRQDPLDRRLWTTSFRPRSTGWHTLEGLAASTSFHALPDDAFAAQRRWERRRATRLRAASDPPPAATGGLEPASLPRRIPRLPLLGLFLVSVLFLWVDERR